MKLFWKLLEFCVKIMNKKMEEKLLVFNFRIMFLISTDFDGC